MDQRKIMEQLLVTLIFLSPALLVVGAIMGLADNPFGERASLIPSILGLGLMATAIRISFPLDRLHKVWISESGGEEYDRATTETGLRTLSLLLNLLSLLTGLLLVLAIMTRASIIDVEIRNGPIASGGSIALLAMAVLWSIVHAISIRSERTSVKDWSTGLIVELMQLGVLVSMVLAVTVLFTDLVIFDSHILSSDDAAQLMLAGMMCNSLGLIFGRGLPNMYNIFKEDQDLQDAGSRSRTVLMPTLLSFVLLFLLIGVLVVYGVGAVEVLDEVVNNPLLLAILGVVFVVLIGSLVAAFSLSRSQDQPLYKIEVSREEMRENIILGTSIGITMLILFYAMLVFTGKDPLDIPRANWFDIFSFGILVAIGPYGFYVANQFKRTKNLEERFPDFLRDLASSHRGGLTLNASVTVASRGDYGALTPEIQKMADQLSWNVSFEQSLERFAERVNTHLVIRAVSLILEASRSGGNTTDVLMAAARDAREIKTLEQERSLNMSIYTMIVYIVFFVFLLVAAVMYSQFVPELLRTSEAAEAIGGTGAGGVSFSTSLSLTDYRTFYFLASIVQGLGDGIIAGMMGTGRAAMGLRHSFIMVLIAWVTFAFMLN